MKTSHKGDIYRQWNSNSVPAPLTKHKKCTDKELMEVNISIICLNVSQLGNGLYIF